MRTRVVVDGDLVREAMALTGARTKREVVHLALASLVERRKRKNLPDLAGQVEFPADFDHKAARELRGFQSDAAD